MRLLSTLRPCFPVSAVTTKSCKSLDTIIPIIPVQPSLRQCCRPYSSVHASPNITESLGRDRLVLGNSYVRSTTLPRNSSFVVVQHRYWPNQAAWTGPQYRESTSSFQKIIVSKAISYKEPMDVLISAGKSVPVGMDNLVLFEESDDKKPVNERELNLGKTIDTIRKRLPCILHSPLPTDILSPSIALHLFPTTHPNLPVVRGRVAYIAALWTSPVVWGRLPGNRVHLEILSERLIKTGPSVVAGGEKLTIKWRARSFTPPDHNMHNGNHHQTKTAQTSSPGPFTASSLYSSLMNKTNTTSDKNEQKIASSDQNDPLEDRHDEVDNTFCGLFIFEFDVQGRIVKHTIENIEENKQSPVITFTDWILRKAKGATEEKHIPSLAYARSHDFERIRRNTR